MKHFFLPLAICVFSYVTSNAQLQNKEIESSIEALNKATIARDKQTLENLTENELTYGHSTGVVQDKAVYITDILSGPATFSQIDNADQTISLVGDLAIVRNISSLKGIKEGTPLNLRIGVLMIWKKEGSGWKLLARQGYKLP